MNHLLYTVTKRETCACKAECRIHDRYEADIWQFDPPEDGVFIALSTIYPDQHVSSPPDDSEFDSVDEACKAVFGILDAYAGEERTYNMLYDAGIVSG